MYGYGGTEADGWALRISRFFTERISQERTPEGHLTIPGLFSWANTVPFGKQVGATPNGRRAGEPINHGANPNNGFRKDGAFTAAAKAIAAVQPGYGNTAPFQLELNDTIIDRENAIENVAAVLKGHFDMGGTLVNVNIVDKDQILAANEDPSRVSESDRARYRIHGVFFGAESGIPPAGGRPHYLPLILFPD